ncbi:MAG: hypothetical protein QQW96_17770 [Tychonema bourrellyi B0820]|uniref:Uncharacterized protein n=1 Tax=Tychonema bourrellyi FEM_GT703 TaxID=2040638 RepID=A0A2G4F160_9CYAN|nr:hypothetical protein [Tychonema bourrellyi]MDQ2099482.1 hypothetical protein [Tychonema bourrellyi B0820]PHX55514.1 hypothetical protein CP500_010430 [Tychonema bourrellyi FEM_GT703]
MATTIEQIVPYQDFRNWKYEVDAESDRILTGVKDIAILAGVVKIFTPPLPLLRGGGKKFTNDLGLL